MTRKAATGAQGGVSFAVLEQTCGGSETWVGGVRVPVGTKWLWVGKHKEVSKQDDIMGLLEKEENTSEEVSGQTPRPLRGLTQKGFDSTGQRPRKLREISWALKWGEESIFL